MSFYSVGSDITDNTDFSYSSITDPLYDNDDTHINSLYELTPSGENTLLGFNGNAVASSSSGYTGSLDSRSAPKQQTSQLQLSQQQHQSHDFMPVNSLSTYQDLPQQYQQQRQYQQQQQTQSMSSTSLNTYGNAHAYTSNILPNHNWDHGRPDPYINRDPYLHHATRNKYTTTNPLMQESQARRAGPPEIRRYMQAWMSPTQCNPSRLSTMPVAYLSTGSSNHISSDMSTSRLDHNFHGSIDQNSAQPLTIPVGVSIHAPTRSQSQVEQVIRGDLPSGCSHWDDTGKVVSDRDSSQDISKFTSKSGKRKRENLTGVPLDSDIEESCQDSEPKSKKRKGAMKEEHDRPESYAAAAALDPELIPEQELIALREASPGLRCRIVVPDPAFSDQSAPQTLCGTLCKTAKDVEAHIKGVHQLHSNKSKSAVEKRCEWEGCTVEIKDIHRHTLESHFCVSHKCPFRGCMEGEDQGQGPFVSKRAPKITAHLKKIHNKLGPRNTAYTYSMPLTEEP